MTRVQPYVSSAAKASKINMRQQFALEPGPVKGTTVQGNECGCNPSGRTVDIGKIPGLPATSSSGMMKHRIKPGLKHSELALSN